jgi:hypothetical protein
LVSSKVTISRIRLDPVVKVNVDSKRFPFPNEFIQAGRWESHPEDGTHLHTLYAMDKPMRIVQRELEHLLVSAQVLHRSGGVLLSLTTILKKPVDSLLVYTTVGFHSTCEAEFKRNILLSAPQTEMMWRWKRALLGEWFTMDGWVGSVDGKGGWRTLLNRIARFNPEEMTSRSSSEVELAESLELVESLLRNDSVLAIQVHGEGKSDWKVRQQEWVLVQQVVETRHFPWAKRVISSDLSVLRNMLKQNE